MDRNKSWKGPDSNIVERREHENELLNWNQKQVKQGSQNIRGVYWELTMSSVIYVRSIWGKMKFTVGTGVAGGWKNLAGVIK